MKWGSWLFAFTCLAVYANALVLVDSTLASACIYYDKGFDWGCNSTGNGHKAYRCRCKNVNWLGTVTNCIYTTSNSTKAIDRALKHVARRCKEKGVGDYTLNDMKRIYENGTAYLRDPVPADRTDVVNTTLRVNATEFEWYYRQFQAFTSSVEKTEWLGRGLVFYWCAVVGIATLVNVLDKLFGLRLLNNNWIRKNILIPSIYKEYHERTYFFAKIIPLNFPTRLEWLVAATFVTLTVVFCVFGYEMELPHPYFTSRWFKDLSLVSYRTDILAISLFPIIFFFGIRNNPFLVLTGIPYRTFNFYHKCCSYVCCVLAIIHSVIWTVYSKSKEGGGYNAWWKDAYFQWGVFATVLISLLIAHSDKIIRSYSYEFFLVIHNLFAIFFIICMYFHLQSLGWLGWVWSMIGIFCFDRIARVCRIILCGGLQTATLTDVGNVVKVTFKKPRLFNYSPGTFVYMYFISAKDPWFYLFQSHPFTVLNTPFVEDGNVTVYFKPQKGITRHIMNRLLTSSKGSVQCNILVEGPYGTSLPQRYVPNDRFVGVAAGLGVTAVYTHFVNILEKNPEGNHVFYWLINDLAHLDWFSQELRFLCSKNCPVNILYTRGKVEDNESLSTELDLKKVANELSITNLPQRVDLRLLVSEETAISQKVLQDVTFIGCGSATFNDQLRYAIQNSISKNMNINVSLQEESFTW
ncbi:HDL248Wp [Eremothecium sinecaudum]|uniref:ferric-chelate reductase (NADPH) n=1 Tax=Eremothecium sinecaudum TaxID=45286 RepID=A0A0X8HS87_9SACH|nr:HDL248Wp [Eremothecium sinecaudum]AMD20496.1 HDL248Wp [Eremothecium sinecaudum]